MRWSAKILRRLAIGLVLLGSLGMMLSMLICVADVVGTNFLDWPVPGTLEITESTMVLIVFGALAFTQEKRGHIRVEILHGLMSSRLKSLADLFTHLLALVFFVLLAWYSFGELSYSWEIQEATMGTIRFPLYHARTLLTAGAGPCCGGGSPRQVRPKSPITSSRSCSTSSIAPAVSSVRAG